MVAAEPSSWKSLKLAEPSIDHEVLSDFKRLAEAAERSDGHPPFSDQSWVELASDHSKARAFTVQVSISDLTPGSHPPSPSPDTLSSVGIAVMVPDEQKNGQEPVLEIVVHPQYRNQGVGSFLVTALENKLGSANFKHLKAWSHGNHPAAARLAAHHHFTVVRELWQMRLGTAEFPTEAARQSALPHNVRLRSFVPGQDETAWLKVNAAAFADHPEQGGTTLADLKARMAEDWFDPEGFLLAVDHQDRILGFHWTKVHRTPGHPELGEVYVVGIAPPAQGSGLGRVITRAGIEYLREKGLRAIMLYVDADNTAAVSLYGKLGFTRWDADVMYAFQEPGLRKTQK